MKNPENLINIKNKLSEVIADLYEELGKKCYEDYKNSDFLNTIVNFHQEHRLLNNLIYAIINNEVK